MRDERHDNVGICERRGRAPGNAPIPLAVIDASNRRWQALTQESVLGLAHDRISDSESLTTFIAEHINDDQTRRLRETALQETAQSISYEFMEKLEMQP